VRDGGDILPDRVIDGPTEDAQAEIDLLGEEIDDSSSDDDEPEAD
jgi:hypothetical protein